MLNAMIAAPVKTVASNKPVSSTLATSLMRPYGSIQTERPSAILSAIAGISAELASSRTIPAQGSMIVTSRAPLAGRFVDRLLQDALDICRNLVQRRGIRELLEHCLRAHHADVRATILLVD
jgi:hypothetical protein